ncbi:MAG: glycosyltransferase N-terminal domain-containing protein [Bacteroidota bacterium]
MRIASWFSPKVLRWLQSRKGWRERLVEAREADKPLIWVHIPSMEVQSQYSLLLQNLQQPYSRAQLLISYQEVPEDWDEEDEHHFLPLDTRGNAEDWLDILMPSMAVMVFPELPEHMLKECKERAIPSYVIGTRLEKGDALLSLVGRGQLRRKLALTSHVFIEDQDTAKHLFSKIKLEESHGTVVGDTEVDELVALVGQAPEVPRLSNFTEGSLTVLVYQAGGMEERMVERLAQNPVFARVKWVIIPRKMDYDRLDKRTEDKSDTELLFSDKTAIREGHRIMWIDEPIGDSFVPYFQYASVAVVGGGFVPLRLPPVWIPAVYGLPIYFGPEYKHRISARELHAQGGAQVFRSRGKLTKLLREHVRQPISEMAKKDIRTYVSNNTGASQKLITELLNRHPNL